MHVNGDLDIYVYNNMDGKLLGNEVFPNDVTDARGLYEEYLLRSLTVRCPRA